MLSCGLGEVRMAGWVYIMTNRPYGTLYTGVTNDLGRRAYEHRENIYAGFTKRYGLDKLVWYEMFPIVPLAIQRVKRIKKWPRQWKMDLINEMNLEWLDLYETLNA
jgi:putative endonuclease